MSHETTTPYIENESTMTPCDLRQSISRDDEMSNQGIEITFFEIT